VSFHIEVKKTAVLLHRIRGTARDKK